MSSSKDLAPNNEEDMFPCSVCIYSMFTDRLDEAEPCIWDPEKESCAHCLEHQTRTCRDVPESAINVVRRLLRLREEYHSFDAADPRRPYNVKCMSVLEREFRGLDSGAAKRRRRQATSVPDGPSLKRRRPTSLRQTIHLIPNLFSSSLHEYNATIMIPNMGCVTHPMFDESSITDDLASTDTFANTLRKVQQFIWYGQPTNYNHLFQHIETEEDKAQQFIKRENIQEAIKAANLKFQKYYGDTEHPKGELLAVAAALHPSRRMRAYDSEVDQ
ncbi:uncharacterized protein CIMG_13436 [Coccidioides immitis RS]|uniref:Uncharacterized protein n=2 Tax=Coccidioides immitis TaxID=5501 RepID=A0A0D8JUZ8_COCIM|nr:uncharacterized protein CIMG_13436 [Coccidioides immitis RS]KJF61117.1 hypothetical protein CIMG_13436 [Coccidioides immitis RS]